MSKKIVRLTESDLMRIVKRVIRENQEKKPEYDIEAQAKYSNPNNLSPAQLAVQFCKSFSTSFFGQDSEAQAMYSVQGLRNMNDYNVFNATISKTKCPDATGGTLKSVLNAKMSPIDKEYDSIVKHIWFLSNQTINVGDDSTLNSILRGLGTGGIGGYKHGESPDLGSSM